MPPEPFLTVKQLGERWNCCRAFIDKLRARGELPFLREGRAVRLRLADIVAFEMAHRQCGEQAASAPDQSTAGQ